MREFEKYEMFKTKCPVCGSKNKVHTELMNRNHKFVGYSLKCCNCGHYSQFLLDYDTNGKSYPEPPYMNGKQRCIQPSYCPKKDCPLYGTCNTEMNDVDFKKEININEIDDSNTLDIHVINKPRFL